MEGVQFTTSDGVGLVGELRLPESATRTRAAAIVCHPHPQFGGDRFDRVVTAVFGALPAAGCAALRFDFRSDFGGGVAERLDLVAALEALDRFSVLDGLPRLVVGYSFGAVVALSTDDPRIVAVGAIAPPLGHGTPVVPTVPVVATLPAHDQFCTPDTFRRLSADWPDVEATVIESADHFLAGHTGVVARVVTEGLLARLDRSTPPG
jgi:alpha/beta superfamily hydrolase